MPYKLRLVQRFEESKRDKFIELERKFMELEKNKEGFPAGRRFLPYMGREALNTLIWECEFPTLEEVNKALSFMSENPYHEELFKQQSQYFKESYVEIYQVLE